MTQQSEHATTTDTQKRAVGYIWVSTPEQVPADQFDADAQKAQILDYARQNGYRIVKWYVDTATSVQEERPELDKIMIDDGTRPSFRAVIVAHSDRIASNIKLYFYYLYTLEREQIQLLSVSEQFDDDNGLGDIYRSLLLFIAEQERKNLTVRTSAGRIQKARLGGYSGGKAPYGYAAVAGRLVIEPKEAEIVRFIFEKAADGKKRLVIADMLNDMGVRSRCGGRIHDTLVRSILSNEPLYRGMYKYGDMDWVKGVHEPILDPIDGD